MTAKKTLSELPNYSFLMDKKYFHIEDFNHSVLLLSFGYYNEKGELGYIYHLLMDNIFVRVFTDYYMAVDYISKLA
jgi:hypothetical protein